MGKDLLEKIDRTGKKKCAKKKIRVLENKKERICSLKYVRSLLFPISRHRVQLSGKVSFCASFKKLRRASLAVETALVLPLFFLGMVTMISFMDIYRVQTEHLSKLCEKTKKAGMYAYGVSGSGAEEIVLPDFYVYEPIGGLIPLPKIPMHNMVKVHAWTGKEYEAFGDGEEDAGEDMVYVTESGSVYHKKITCSYLKLSIKTMPGKQISSARNAYGEKYAACETCSRGQKPAGNVYVTNTGNRYHNLGSCSGLKRTVRLVKHSHTGNMASCSRCG